MADLSRADDVADVNKIDDLGDIGKIDEPIDAPASSLTEGEQRSVGLYTGWGYDHINSHLRGVDPGLGRIYDSPELDRIADEVSSGLAKMPAHEGVTYRGTNLPDDVMSQVRQGGTFSDPAFLSSSRDVSTAQTFRSDGNAMLHIDGRSGKDVSGLSAHGNEAEILFDRATEFRVVKKELNPDGYWDIHLEER
jgi:hypothetical protein